MEARWLPNCTTIEAFGRACRHLSAGHLAGPASALLRSFNRISHDVLAALRQESSYNQRVALRAVEDRLDSLVRELNRSSEPYAVRFSPTAARWREIVHRIKEPEGEGYGNWVGGHSVTYDPAEKKFYMYYRLRQPLGLERPRAAHHRDVRAEAPFLGRNLEVTGEAVERGNEPFELRRHGRADEARDLRARPELDTIESGSERFHGHGCRTLEQLGHTTLGESADELQRDVPVAAEHRAALDLFRGRSNKVAHAVTLARIRPQREEQPLFAHARARSLSPSSAWITVP